MNEQQEVTGRPQGGMRSDAGRAAYWRMQYESAIGALADLIAEHTETVDALDAANGRVERVEALSAEHANCTGCPTPWWLKQALA